MAPDNIDDILNEPDRPHYTELRPILQGRFNLSHLKIPFFQGLMSLEEANKELRLVEDLPADLRSNWRLEELFQREIDWDRVDNDLVKGYLRRPEKLKFFNSLTVALLPLTDARQLAAEYGAPSGEPELRPSLRKHPWQTVNAGRVQLVLNDDSPHGFIRWDPKRIFAATIDGQHRLAALQRLAQAGNLSSSALETTISVIFLVLDQRAGFDARMITSQDENPILTVVREVFIDLNKHSREVRRSRRILLDDQEIEARCVRSLLCSRMGSKEIDRLPLGLVHWQHNESAKFNLGEKTGCFITTVELLYSIVQDLLDLKRPKDPSDPKDVNDFVRSIERSLRLSETIAEAPNKYLGLAPLQSYVDVNHLKPGFEQPFANLNSQYLRACDDSFEQNWRPLVVGVLTQFAPYRDFINEVDQRGGLTGELASYLVLPTKAQKQQADEWGEKRQDKIDIPLKQLAALKDKDWAFYAVFQKALLRATSRAWRHFCVVKKDGHDDVKQFLGSWISFLNTMHARGVFSVKATLPPSNPSGARLWLGISLNSVSETIRYTGSAVERISGLIYLWWHFNQSCLSRVGTFMKHLAGKRSAELYPTGSDAASSLRTGLRSAVRSDEDMPPDEIAQLVEDLLHDLIALAKNTQCLPEATSEDAGDPTS